LARVARSLGVIVVAAALLPACRRKLPGPEECHALAERWLAVVSQGRSQHPNTPREQGIVEDTVLKMTTQCLTRPYDREMVECVVSGAAPKACFASFESRSGR
jgi:hypothetical protein